MYATGKTPFWTDRLQGLRGVWPPVFLACVMGLGACEKKTEGTPVAQVGQVRLTKEDLLARIPQPFLGKVSTKEKRRLVESWVEEELLYQEGLSQKLERDADVAVRIEKAKRGLVVAELLTREFARNADVMEGEIVAYYEANQEAFQREHPEIRVRHILVEDRNALNRVTERLREGEAFGQIAREMSIDASAEDGGDLGYFTPEMVDPVFWDACQEARFGQIARATTRLGLHVIEVMDRREAGSVRDLVDVRGEIRQRILTERRQAQRKKLLDEIRARMSWSMHLDVLE